MEREKEKEKERKRKREVVSSDGAVPSLHASDMRRDGVPVPKVELPLPFVPKLGSWLERRLSDGAILTEPYDCVLSRKQVLGEGSQSHWLYEV